MLFVENVKNFIEASGSYFYGHVFSDETLAKLKEQHSNMFANRRAQQNAFFNYLREKNTNVIKVADNNIASLITPSDFFYKTITEEGLKFQAENDVHILEDAVELLLFEDC